MKDFYSQIISQLPPSILLIIIVILTFVLAIIFTFRDGWPFVFEKSIRLFFALLFSCIVAGGISGYLYAGIGGAILSGLLLPLVLPGAIVLLILVFFVVTSPIVTMIFEIVDAFSRSNIRELLSIFLIIVLVVAFGYAIWSWWGVTV